MRFASQKSPLPADPAVPAAESRFSRFTRRHRFVAATLALAVALLSGGVLAITSGVSSAQAHNGTSSADCYKITNNYTNFNTSKGQNSIAITYKVAGAADSTQVVKTYQFANSYTAPEVFPDSSKSYDWSVQITASDNAKYNFFTKGTTTGCVKPTTPTVSAAATACTVTNAANIPVTVSLGNLTNGRSYTVTAAGLGDAQTVKASSSTATVTFDAPITGGTWTVTVTDTADKTLTATTKVTAASCPTIGGITVEVTQCTVPGQNTSVTIQSDAFVPGKNYTVTTDTGYKGSPVASDAKTLTIALPTGATPTTVTVSVAFGTNADAVKTAQVTIQPCPSGIMSVTINPTACTVGDTTRTASVTLGGLVVDRTYQLQIDGKNAGQAFKATKTEQTFTDALDKVSVGTHTVTVIDVATPSVTKSADFAADACAQTPVIATDLQQCSVPTTGTGEIDATLTQLVDGRKYTVAVTTGGTAVTGYPTTVTASGTTASVKIAGLAPGKDYTLVVTDAGEPKATATATVTLAKCPPEPEVGGVTISCIAGTSPALNVTVSDLPAGNTWTVTLERQNSDGSYTVVGTPRGPLSTAGASDLTFPGLTNGVTYRVTFQSNEVATLNSSSVIPVSCGTSTPPVTPPTTPTGVLGTSVSALATTGADVVAPLIGGILLLQLGAALTVLAVLRKRKEARG